MGLGRLLFSLSGNHRGHFPVASETVVIPQIVVIKECGEFMCKCTAFKPASICFHLPAVVEHMGDLHRLVACGLTLVVTQTQP